MKKIIALFVVLSAATAQAEVSPDINYKLLVETMESGKVTKSESFTVSTLIGEASKVQKQKRQSYVQQCDWKNGVLELAPTILTTGFEANIKTSGSSQNAIVKTTIDVEYSELLSMKDVETGGCHVQIPATRSSKQSNEVFLSAGQQVTFSSEKEDGLRVTLTRLK